MLKIAIFSPLPPAKSGISYYALKVALALKNYYQITFFVDKDYEPETEQLAGLELVLVNDTKETLKKLNKYDLVIYHFGNNGKYHSYMYEMALKIPGLVILHDFVLHHFIAEMTLSKGKTQEYLKKIERWYPDYLGEANFLVKNRLTPDLFKYPLNDEVVSSALGVIVHSNHLKNLLAAKFEKNVFVIPHFVSAIKPVNFEIKKTRSTIEISCFGFVSKTKRPHIVLSVFQKLTEEFDNLKLNFVGELTAESLGLLDFIKDNNLVNKVTFTGFCSDNDLDQHLKNTDICLNLRYPSSGETSGTLSLALAHGLPTIVSKYQQFDEYPDEAVLKVPLDANEKFVLYDYLKKLILDEDFRRTLGQNGQRYVEENCSIDLVTQKYKKVIDELVLNKSSLSSTLNLLSSEQNETDSKGEDVFDSLSGNGLKDQVSGLCRQRDFELSQFHGWSKKMGETLKFHRKLWEYFYISQSLFELGFLSANKKGVGFGVGREPLVSLFASFGCEILATDLNRPTDLNFKNICPADDFDSLVKYRSLDMRNLPPLKEKYDFCWSASSIERLGSIEAGFNFIRESLNYLKPGGVAVYTSEYNLLSNEKTLDNQEIVIFRKQDIERLITELTEAGYEVATFDFNPGDGEVDKDIDFPPYDNNNRHLKIYFGGFIITSFGLIIKKKEDISQLPTIFIECSHTYNSELNTGIQRVVRNIIRQAEALAPKFGYQIKPVVLRGEYFEIVPVPEVFREKKFFSNKNNLASAAKVKINKFFPLISRIFQALDLDSLILVMERRIKEIFLRLLKPSRITNLDNYSSHEGNIFLVPELLLGEEKFWSALLRFKMKGGNVQSIVYDIIPLTHPETVALDTGQFKIWTDHLLKYSSQIITISKFVSQEVLNYLVKLRLKRDPILNFFYLGSELDFANNDTGSVKMVKIFSDRQPVFLVVGSIEPRKNHKYILDAFDIFWRRGGKAKLVILGKHGWKNDNLIKRIEQHAQYNKKLYLVRDASDDELAFAYKKSTGLIIASIVEGFGLPIVEAWQYGLPVFCSDIAVFREIADNQAVFFDLKSAQDLAEKIRVYCDKSLGLSEKSCQKKWFSWQESVEQLLRVIIRGNNNFIKLTEIERRELFAELNNFNERSCQNFTVDEILVGEDKDLILNIYQKVLKRKPDKVGFNNYLKILRKKKKTPIEILGSIRYSVEGRKNKVKIRGLKTKLVSTFLKGFFVFK